MTTNYESKMNANTALTNLDHSDDTNSAFVGGIGGTQMVQATPIPPEPPAPSGLSGLTGLKQNPTRTQAIQRYLDFATHPDLAGLYTPAMEVQVNVAKEDGIRVESGDIKGRGFQAFTNGLVTWKPFRIPFNAKTEPTYTDLPMNFPLGIYAEGIGMTGWDWEARASRWVAFDFDAIIGHSDRHGKKLDDKQLNEIQEVLKNVPFVTLRKSTSGKGLHLYVFLDPIIQTANHTEHAALARAILSMLSGLTGFDFGSKVDTCGGNMWVWHRKMYSEWKPDNAGVKNEGLKLLKAGGKLSTVPANWRDHINVVSQKARKTVPSFVYDMNVNDPDKLFAQLTGQRTEVSLDSTHKGLIEWLAANNCCWWWDSDSHMLVTHTAHLKEAHTALKMCGKFDTLATGVDRGFDHNVFCFPMRDGGWIIRRYSIGTKEHDSWDSDRTGWTHCYYNREPDLHTLARLNGGVEHEKGGYNFQCASSIQAVLTALGVQIDLPSFVLSRKAVLRPSKSDGKIIVHIDAEGNDDGTKMSGWINEKKLWKRVFKANVVTNHEAETNDSNFDDFLRHIVTASGQDAGWVLRKGSSWTEEPLVHIKHALSALDRSPKEITQIVGSSVLKAWELVNKPFQPEYPGNREWNRNAAQLAITPTLDLDNLSYPTWRRVLNHCGKGINEAIGNHSWCQNNGITSGEEFLMLWIASLLKQPNKPMTYLAFWGNQDSGKSIFHEMITEILITCGVMAADQALQNQQNFNSELANAILCTVEETDLSKNKTAYGRIKDWVTSPQIMIHPKHGIPYMMPNCLHFVQCCNAQEEVPVFEGDTRITLIYVEDLTKEELIPKEQLRVMLRKEAPDFLAAVLAMELPTSDSRLAVPTIDTEGKLRATEKNMDSLQLFIKEKVFERDGHCIDCETFLGTFHLTLDDRERAYWTKNRIGRELPAKFPRGRVGSVQSVHYGNMSFEESDVALNAKYVKHNLQIRLETKIAPSVPAAPAAALVPVTPALVTQTTITPGVS